MRISCSIYSLLYSTEKYKYLRRFVKIPMLETRSIKSNVLRLKGKLKKKFFTIPQGTVICRKGFTEVNSLHFARDVRKIVTLLHSFNFMYMHVHVVLPVYICNIYENMYLYTYTLQGKRERYKHHVYLWVMGLKMLMILLFILFYIFKFSAMKCMTSKLWDNKSTLISKNSD